MDDKGETTMVVHCDLVTDYEIDDCAFCAAPVLRPTSVPEDAEPLCPTCTPVYLAMARNVGAKINTHTIMPQGVN